MALGHTRWATHGGVTGINAHPHLDCKGEIAVVHNGIIENYQDLREMLSKNGHKFESETDSEVFPHLVEEYLKLGFTEAVWKAFSMLHGRNAFVVFKPGQRFLIGLRSGSPLVVGVGKDEYFLASDVPAFIADTRDVIYLEDNQAVVLKDDGHEVFDVASGRKINSKIEKVSWDISKSEKGKYEHFLLKEILEQPEVILNASHQDKAKIEQLTKLLKDAFGSYLVACGTASYAALYGTYIFSLVAKKHINFAVASEFENYQHFITPKSLVFAVSQSGETADILDAVNVAKSRGAKTVAIVNVMGSTLERTADYSFMTNAGPEIAVVSTKAFSAQLTVLFLLAHKMAGKLTEGQKLIEKTAHEIGYMLNSQFLEKVKKLAEKIGSKEHIYVIGKGQNFPIALEAALKIKEASYIHGEGFAAGELKHGVITLIEKGTPCIVLFANDNDRDYVLGNAMEMKARGGMIIGIGPDDNEVFDEFIKVPDIADCSALINAPVVQLLGYYLGIFRGVDPDKPRNLAKSVTVK